MTAKNDLRSTIFRHLDGLATAPVAVALNKKGVLDYLLENKDATLAELTSKFKANEGYLNVGLRILCSQGFLDYQVNNETQEIKFGINAKTGIAFSWFHLYEDVVDLLHFSSQFHPRLFEEEPFKKLNVIFEKYKNNYGIVFSDDTQTAEIQHQILKHIEGYLVGPTMVRLGMNGMFHKYFMEISFRPEEYHKSP
ncbi:MAG TPA: hypothetical protein VK476_03505, partial [Flavobacterium sp.]|nr:hypothetical protein [Flavobacterium sp.]